MLRLQAQAAALEQQILALQEQSAPFQLLAMQVQQQAAAEQTQLATAQVELASANVALADTTVRLRSVQATLQSDRQRLASLVVASYRITTSGTALTVLLNSRNLVDAIDTVLTLGHVTHSMDTLVADVRRSADQLTALQSQQRDEQQQIAAEVNAVQGLRSQALTDEARFQQEARQLTGKAATMTQRLEVLMVRLAAAEGVQAANLAATGNAAGSIAGALPPFAFGPQVDDFPWGQCTWYVASLRPVTWAGDAWEWQAAAAAQGKHEGLVPKPGAIVVFSRGNGYSDLGHVAYVQTVVGPTSFIIDEANAYGLGVVDKRLVPSLTDVAAFIY
jgi:surface antigen